MVIKRKGMLAIPVTLLAVVYLFLAGTFFTLYSSQFGMIQAGRTALQAQQYAEIEADTLRLLSYDDLDATGAHARQAITSVAGADGWQDEITIAAEQTYGADAQNKQRIATIKVYKDGDTLSRYSLQVPLSSKGSSGSYEGSITDPGWTQLPNGLILQWGTFKGGTVTFPKQFSHACLSVTATMTSYFGAFGNKSPYVARVDSYNTTSAYIQTSSLADEQANAWYAASATGHYFAIGY